MIAFNFHPQVFQHHFEENTESPKVCFHHPHTIGSLFNLSFLKAFLQIHYFRYNRI